MKRLHTIGAALAWAVFASAPAAAATLQWNATISDLFEDLGGATYSGTLVGDPFFGMHSVPDVCAAGCVSEPQGPTEMNYVFASGTAFVSDGSTQVNGVEASVNIQDNAALDADEALLVSQLTGQNVVAGELVDVWAGASENAGASIEWEVVYLALDETLYDNLEYRATPPPLAAVDVVVFTIDEMDGLGTTIFSALPEPATSAAWLALTGAFAALGRRRV